ncbi:DNA replication/repair protein RecF [Anaerosinus gibii]|uniref:DNA replication and repair protein RecF n=1 Tax=Selenobaculum gibii TaxID=3054208 RepID=A0A9Y2AJT1_9FIRM|nr:DNA replication/repair protein RecF [Selenobaculum gbiensis]WIW70755.1 DNA replication/repair protein RecF [Selenobaculum gbiensis]
MRIKKISLHNYRNYSQLSLDLSHNLNIFLGENAQGKTNIIEAIYYAAIGSSHRTSNDNELICWEKESAKIYLCFERMSVENELEFNFPVGKRREISYNGHKIKPKELIGTINVVLFSPEDLYLIKGAPAARRKFLDTEISQANPSYYSLLSQYNRVIAQRNVLLKKIKENQAKNDLLELWNQQLSELATKIVKQRIYSLKKLNMLANLMHRRISTNKENLEIGYIFNGEENFLPSDLNTWYNNKLAEVQAIDIRRGFTSVGPHRDDIILKVNGINLRSFGSQGQQRTGVLALKLAELEFIKSETGEYPVLLLDDVMSELDVNRRNQLLLFIRERIQTFITATDRSYFPKENVGKYYKVSAGSVME